MNLHDWQQQQQAKRLQPVRTTLDCDDVTKMAFQNVDPTVVMLFPENDEVKALVSRARQFLNQVRIRPGEQAPRLRKGEGKMVKKATWRQAGAIVSTYDKIHARR